MFSRASKTPESVSMGIATDMSTETSSGASRSSFYFFVLGACFYWASIPPLGIWPLAFLVPVAWTVTVESSRKLRFRTVYLGALLFWLASIWWIACPHPMTGIGLLALAGYLAVYWPMFFAAGRIAVHRLRIPAVLALPVCWIGCEYLRNHVLGGFSFCSLEHALYLKPALIQIADLSGGYLVGGMIMLVGTGIGSVLSGALCPESMDRNATEGKKSRPRGSFSAVLALTVLLASFGYGVVKQRGVFPDQERRFNIAACQGNIPVTLDAPPERIAETYEQFIDLSYKAVMGAKLGGESLDLIIWPETVCPVPLLLVENEESMAATEWTDRHVEACRQEFDRLTEFIRQLGTPLLVGLSTLVFEGDPDPVRLNSALLVDPKAEHTGPRYDKVHLVMFGEYIPFSRYLPKGFFLKTLCQEAGRGKGPVAMPIRDEFFSVNICFESTIPHLVRHQVLTLKKQDRNPAILVNVSNDGWFRFSQQIDQHLATHVFRAVENRRPCISATNGGFSAIIDDRGRIREIGGRQAAEAVVHKISPATGETPLYHVIGDGFPFCCAVFLLGLLGFGLIRKERGTATG